MKYLVMLILAWCWTPPAASCAGTPDTPVAYQYVAMTRVMTPWMCCCDDQGQAYDCAIATFGPSLPFGEEIPHVLTPSGEVCSEVDPTANPAMLPLPPLDGVSAWPWFNAPYYPVAAKDEAGNWSWDCP